MSIHPMGNPISEYRYIPASKTSVGPGGGFLWPLGAMRLPGNLIADDE